MNWGTLDNPQNAGDVIRNADVILTDVIWCQH